MQECIGGMRPPPLLANDHTGSILVCRAILVKNLWSMGLQLKPRESADELGSIGGKSLTSRLLTELKPLGTLSTLSTPLTPPTPRANKGARNKPPTKKVFDQFPSG